MESGRKYKFTGETIFVCGTKLHRIMALRSFGDVKKGDLGGFIEKEENLSHEGDCWVYNNAKVYNGGRVALHATIHNSAMIFGMADITGHARVMDCATVSGQATVHGYAEIRDRSTVTDYSNVYEHSKLCDNAKAGDRSEIRGNALISGDTFIGYYEYIWGDAKILSDRDHIFNSGLGDEHSSITFARSSNSGSVLVACPGFRGTLEELEKHMNGIRDTSEAANDYLALINAIKIHFGIDRDCRNNDNNSSVTTNDLEALEKFAKVLIKIAHKYPDIDL